MGCGYQGYEFGAGYMDSICCDGRLLDADNCDEHGQLYDDGCDLPCPGCRPLDAMHRYADDNAHDPDTRWPRYSAWHLVMDIRRNRGMKTIPLILWLLVRAYHEVMN